MKTLHLTLSNSIADLPGSAPTPMTFSTFFLPAPGGNGSVRQYLLSWNGGNVSGSYQLHANGTVGTLFGSGGGDLSGRRITLQTGEIIEGNCTVVRALLHHVHPAPPKKTAPLTFQNVVAGDRIRYEYNNCGPRGGYGTFLGFTNTIEQYSEAPVFATLREAKEWVADQSGKPCKSMADIVAFQDTLPYGHSVYAIIRDDEGYTWGAYIYDGAFVAGSSANRLRITRA